MAHVLKIMLTGRVLIYFFPSSQRLQPATSAHTSITFLSLRLHSLSLQVLFLSPYASLSPPNLSLRPPLSYPPPHHAGLRKHDVCFLITVRPNLPYGTRFDRRQNFVEQTGLAYVRGCEVQGMLDDRGRVIEEGGHCM